MLEPVAAGAQHEEEEGLEDAVGAVELDEAEDPGLVAEMLALTTKFSAPDPGIQVAITSFDCSF